MGRRGLTVLLGAVLVVLMAAGIAAAPVPYVVLGPGPTVDVLGSADGRDVIEVDNADTSDSAGQLRLTTVSVAPDIWLIDAIRGWFDDEDAVVPRELIYPPDRTEEEVDEQNQRDLQMSQSAAEVAALRKLGYPVQVTVTEVLSGAPAEGKLEPGDVITSVDGTEVTSTSKLQELIRAKPAGTALTIGYRRDGRDATTSVTTQAANGAPRLGVAVENRQPNPYSFKIDPGNIGGPSAGLMFALGILDKLDPDDLTGGMIIAGTGTIDDEGRVGPIGGVAQKLVGARRANATVFLTPADNCAEAVANAQPGLKLVKVTTLDDALAALRALREGREPTLCSRQ